MRAVLEGVGDVAEANSLWVAWNLFLAVLPWLLAVVLFRRRRRLGVVWWLGTAACLALLPNAAYVLTDVIHLPRLIRAEPSNAVVLAGILPMFGALFVLGFAAYADTLRRMTRFVTARGWLARTWPLVVAVHAATALGIYAGRVHRFNSWDLVLRPGDVLALTLGGLGRPLAAAGIVVTFGVLAVGYLMASALGGVATPFGMLSGAEVKKES